MTKDAKYWVSRFGVHDGDDHSERAEKVLVRMGARAVPALVGKLRDRDCGWQAAMVLGMIGLPAAKMAVPALVKMASRGAESATDLWSARALAQMGRLETVWAMAGTKRLLYAVVVGLKEARPASYVMFEELLARKDEKLTKHIAHELAPGSAAYEPPGDSFETVAAAARSPHAVIRKDAILALPQFRGMKAKKRTVEVVLPLLGDRDAEVRRLAVLALGRCKSAAKPAIPVIRPLLRDRVALVRQYAKMTLDELGA